MATNYGSDTYCLTDIPLISTQVTDPVQLIGQRIARRLQTPRGALAVIGDEADFGFDLRQFVNGRVNPSQRAAIAQQIEAECVKDEEVSAADVDVTFSSGSLSVTLKLTTSAGPFSLVLSVSAVTATAFFGAA